MKINAIKTPMARKIMSTAMLAAATLGVTNVMAKPSKTQDAMLNQTEVMSPEAAKAAQAYTQQTRTISQERNYKLEKLLMDVNKANSYFVRGTSGEEILKGMLPYYTEYGTFVTAFMLELQTFSIGMDLVKNRDNTNAEESYVSEIISEDKFKYVKTKTQELQNWFDNKFANYMLGNITDLASKVTSGEKVSGEEISNKLDKISEDLESVGLISSNDRYNYGVMVERFKSQQKGDKVQSLSDLIAFKTYYLSRLAVFYAMKSMGYNSENFLSVMCKCEPTP